jgi:hypothetical protein
MTYVRWKRELILGTIDRFIDSTKAGGTDQDAPPQSSLDGLLAQMSEGLPAPEVIATMNDLLRAHRNLCSEQQLEVMQELTHAGRS